MINQKQYFQKNNGLFTLIAYTPKFYILDFSYSNLPENFNKIYVFHEAEGEHFINNKKHRITNCSIHLVKQGTKSKLRLKKCINKITLLSFDNAFLENNRAYIPFLPELYFFLNENRNPVFKLKIDFFSNTERLLFHIQKESSIKKEREDFNLITMLQNFILSVKKWNEETIAHEFIDNLDENIPNVLKQFMAITDKHWKLHRRPYEYAKDLGVSRNHLNKLLLKHFNKTVHVFLDEKLIEKAKELLIDGKMTIKQIAYELNFKDDAYFNHFFKKYTSITPNSFRKSL
jgi:AraC family transcriptional regulator, transcriptional activator of pobA